MEVVVKDNTLEKFTYEFGDVLKTGNEYWLITKSENELLERILLVNLKQGKTMSYDKVTFETYAPKWDETEVYKKENYLIELKKK